MVCVAGSYIDVVVSPLPWIMRRFPECVPEGMSKECAPYRALPDKVGPTKTDALSIGLKTRVALELFPLISSILPAKGPDEIANACAPSLIVAPAETVGPLRIECPTGE